MNQNVDAGTNNGMLKPLKYPGLGLYMSFKIFMEILNYIGKCSIQGFVYVFGDVPSNLWRRDRGKVDQAYKGRKYALRKDDEKKKSVLSMDLNDLLKKTKYIIFLFD